MSSRPIIIVDPSRTQSKGRDAQSMNITAAKAVADILAPTLGPKGMDKMMVDPTGEIIITNDGAAILASLAIEHPSARAIVNIARVQQDEAGDGTTSAVLLAGEMLKKAEKLIADGVHPTSIVNGYRMASRKALEILEGLAITISDDDLEHFKNIAKTAMTGKHVDVASDKLSGVCVDTINAIMQDGKADITKWIKFQHKVGGTVNDTEFINGIVLSSPVADFNMPHSVKDAKIAMIDVGFQARKTSKKSKITITTAQDLEAFNTAEEDILLHEVAILKKLGANVLITTKGMDDLGLAILAKAGILGIRRIHDNDMQMISSATSAQIVSDIHALDESNLGYAGIVEERGGTDDYLLYIEGCHNPKSVTIIIHGSTEQVCEAIERALDDALQVVADTMEDKTLVAGGGASEIELALRLKEFAHTLPGREQMAALAFAQSFEVIPRTLAINAGLDPIDSIVALRSSHQSKDGKHTGLNVDTGEAVDMYKANVVEPLRIKTQMVKSASDAVTMILRVDDILAAARKDVLDVDPTHNAHNYDMTNLNRQHLGQGCL